MNELWCVHIEGPDDVVAVPSKVAAATVAAHINKQFADSQAKYGVRINARVKRYTYGAESHQRNLDENFHEYASLVRQAPNA